MFLETAELTRAYGDHHGAGIIGGYGLPASIVEQLKRSRANARCAACQQPIHTAVALQVRGVKTFHPSCAARLDAQARQAAPHVIGRLRGCALTIDSAGCHVINRDGSEEHESFTLDVFDASLQSGGQVLRASGHDSLPLRGCFRRLEVDARRLVFDFELTDGTVERATVDRVRRGDLRGCSIEFVPGVCQLRNRILTHRRATLVGIALTNRPQWFGTWVEAQW